jgi:hypothetical protein
MVGVPKENNKKKKKTTNKTATTKQQQQNNNNIHLKDRTVNKESKCPGFHNKNVRLHTGKNDAVLVLEVKQVLFRVIRKRKINIFISSNKSGKTLSIMENV